MTACFPMLEFKMALNRNAKTSLCTFLLGSSTILLRYACNIVLDYNFISLSSWLPVFIICGLVYCVVLFVFFRNRQGFEVAIRSSGLGYAFGFGYHLSSSETWMYFGYYFMALTFFHFSEYFTTAVTNPRSLSLQSFLLDHSREYGMAAVASWIEFIVELYLFPGLKQLYIISIVGILLVIVGEVVRKSSMFTAKTNFNHYVQYVKQPGHELVTNGIYSLCRHPSYVGWFYWSIGTQLILCNPLCLVAYTIVSWKFFNERINEEEVFLLNFFTEDYVDYKKRVGTGLPFISGFQGYHAT